MIEVSCKKTVIIFPFIEKPGLKNIYFVNFVINFLNYFLGMYKSNNYQRKSVKIQIFLFCNGFKIILLMYNEPK